MEQHKPSDINDDWKYGVAFKNLLNALEACGDTSVLEALYPWLPKTTEGKAILEKKKATVEKEAPKDKSSKDKDQEKVILELTRREAEVICTLFQHISGSVSGARGVTEELIKRFYAQGIGYYANCFENSTHEIKFVDNWSKMGKVTKGI